MSFASIFIPGFMLQAVVRLEPELRNCATILVDADSPLRPVIQLNEAASKTGVRPGMPKVQALQFGAMEVRERSSAQERIAHAVLLDLGWSVSPRVEAAGADTIVLDLAGLSALFGSEEDIARRLAERAKRLGFTAQIATASNLDAAIFASRAFAGITVIPEGEEAAIIGKAPATALFPSAIEASLSRHANVAASSPRQAPDLLETLERWGVNTCGQLAALPVLQLSERLGQEGVRLHQLAQGGAVRAMVLAQPATFFEEEMELENAVAEFEPLTFFLGQLLDRVCARLIARSLAAGEIRLRFQLEPSFEKEFRPSQDGPRRRAAPELFERTLHLPVPMNDSKTLLKLLVLHLQSAPPPAPVLKIILAAHAARPRILQSALFSPICPDPEKVELTVARLANLVGDSNIGSPELLDTHRPEGFRMRRFVPNQHGSDPRHTISRSPRSQAAAGMEAGGHAPLPLEYGGEKDLHTAFRVFRPPWPARVEIRQGRPAKVASPGFRGWVVAASGPWRSSGDWWKEDGWQVDEWDLEIQFERSCGSEVLSYSESPARAMRATSLVVPTQAAAHTYPQELDSHFRGNDEEAVKRGARSGVYRLFYDLASQKWFVRGAYD
jgi:protein ImuB